MLFISIFIIILFSLSLFLGKELLKKFVLTKNFINNSHQSLTWKYLGNRKPGLYNIVLRGEKPFCALIGFNLTIPVINYSGFDHYGFAKSDKSNTIIISTYLGKKSCEFQFLINTALDTNHIIITSSEKDQLLMPASQYTPHWYQRIGFYG